MHYGCDLNMVTTTFPGGFNTIELHLQTSTVTVTNAALLANSVFRTGISTQLSPTIAMAIHQIDENITPKGAFPTGQMDNIVWVLSEDLSATDASGELTDPRTLIIGGRTYIQQITTTGQSIAIEDLIKYIKLDPPIWTIAQQLNLLCAMVEHVAVSSPDWDIHLRLHYTLHPISAINLQALMQRLNLSPQP